MSCHFSCFQGTPNLILVIAPVLILSFTSFCLFHLSSYSGNWTVQDLHKILSRSGFDFILFGQYPSVFALHHCYLFWPFVTEPPSCFLFTFHLPQSSSISSFSAFLRNVVYPISFPCFLSFPRLLFASSSFSLYSFRALFFSLSDLASSIFLFSFLLSSIFLQLSVLIQLRHLFFLRPVHSLLFLHRHS